MEFVSCYPGGKNYAAQLRHGLVHVTAGPAVSGSNAALTAGGSVSGTVTSANPVAAQSGICVDRAGHHGEDRHRRRAQALAGAGLAGPIRSVPWPLNRAGLP